MKRIILFLIFLSVVFAQPLFAEINTVYLSKNNIEAVFAVNPYFSDEQRKDIENNNKELVPVGVLIQNYGKEDLSVEDIGLIQDDAKKVYISKISPYLNRSLNQIVGPSFGRNAQNVTMDVEGIYNKKDSLKLRVNEIFYPQWIKAGESYYGLIFLEARNGLFHPRELENLNGLWIELTVLDSKFDNEILVKIPLSLSDDKTQLEQIEVKSIKQGNALFENVFIGDENDKPKTAELYNAYSEISDCLLKRKVKFSNIRVNSYGRFAVAKIMFNQYGDYLSHKTETLSGYSMVDKKMDDFFKDFKGCKIQNVKTEDEKLKDKPFYSCEIVFGDAEIAPKSVGCVE